MSKESVKELVASVTEDTRVQLGLAVGCVVFAFWLGAMVSDIRRDVRELRADVAKAWTVAEMQEWSLSLKSQNPGLVVPDARVLAARASARRTGHSEGDP
ncbi:MAG: hypothetical protein AB1705_08535 [Verrucomicrobiota bacterium]